QGLHSGATKKAVKDTFSRAGKVSSITIWPSYGVAVVRYEKLKDASNASTSLNGMNVSCSSIQTSQPSNEELEQIIGDFEKTMSADNVHPAVAKLPTPEPSTGVQVSMDPAQVRFILKKRNEKLEDLEDMHKATIVPQSNSDLLLSGWW